MTVKKADALLRLAGKAGLYPCVKRDRAIALALGEDCRFNRLTACFWNLENRHFLSGFAPDGKEKRKSTAFLRAIFDIIMHLHNPFAPM